MFRLPTRHVPAGWRASFDRVMVEMNGKFGSAVSPSGGMKQSGNDREGGVWALEEFLEVKAVSDWR